MTKSAQNTQQKTTNEPWSGVKPFLKSGYGDAQSLYKQGAPGYYPGTLIAPQSDNTQAALGSLAQRGANGSDLTRAAQGQLQDTLGGTYLNGETPGFQGALNAATRPIIDNYTKTIMPGIDSNFSAAGRYGSGAHGLAEGDAATGLSHALGDTTSRMVYQNYGDERNRQIQGMLFAPELANQDYKDIAAQGQAGAAQDAFKQSQIDAELQKYNYDSNKDFNWLQQYLGMLNGAQGGSTTTTQPKSAPNPFTGAIGGAGVGAQIGSIIPGLGTGIGALAGGGLGLLGSLFG